MEWEVKKSEFHFTLGEGRLFFMPEKNINCLEPSEDDGCIMEATITKSFADLSYLYNKTGYIDEDGKVVGILTEKGLELISLIANKKGLNIDNLIRLRYEIWFEYAQMLFRNSKENILEIFSNFGEIESYYSKLKKFETELTELVSPSQINLKENEKKLIQTFEELFTFGKEIEEQKPIKISKGKEKYFNKHFLPSFAIISTVYWGLIYWFFSVSNITKNSPIEMPEIIKIIISGILIWIVITIILYKGLKFILKPKIE